MHLKNKIHQHLLQLLSEKINGINEALVSAKESRDADTKSSAGDKHETSRALAQIELDKLEVQLGTMLVLQKELNAININKKNDKVALGSLVFTNDEKYFISIGIGKIKVEDEIYYAISLASPIGELMKGKKTGDKIKFQSREILIDKVV